MNLINQLSAPALPPPLQGNEDVFAFLGTVLDQVVGQFPCQYVHIGGDEVPKLRWEHCDKCQARMQQVGMARWAEV
jgi:N-acetyl-beta-hexosaminidase